MAKKDPYLSDLEKFILGVTEVAPAGLAAGAGILGGIAGTVFPVVGNVAGAAAGASLGAAAGTGLKLAGDAYESNKAQQVEDRLISEQESELKKQEEENRRLAKQSASMALLSNFL